MELGWKWLTPAALTNIVLTTIAIFVVQALDGWHGLKMVESVYQGVNLTATGKIVVILIGWSGLFITAGVLSIINRRARDFNLKGPRRQVRLVDVPSGTPAVAPLVKSEV
jgi:hypothetical protein